MNLNHLLYGGDYNPEQWRNVSGIWDEDVRLMYKAHINTATWPIKTASASANRSIATSPREQTRRLRESIFLCRQQPRKPPTRSDSNTATGATSLS